MLQRHLMSSLKAALADSPVVLLVGARQTGKSTLVQALAAAGFPAHYLTLDDTTVLAAVRHNPPDFLAGFTGRLIIDEVQRAPELLLALKMAVDKDRAPGRFILTGSANVLTLPRVADSLAGRMEVLHLRPFSQGELSGRQESFIEAVFRPDFPLPLTVPALARPDLLARMMTGGYPEVVARPQAARQRAWCKSYLTTLLQRDIRDLANIEGLVELPRLLAILAARAGNLLNLADVSRSSGFAQTTLKRYFALLETIFLVETLPAWAGSRTRRLVKTPKVYLSDTGLLSYLQGITAERLQLEPTLAGALTENFVVTELRKQAAWSSLGVELYHFRTGTEQEVDVVLEDSAGHIVGLEVKAGTSVGAGDFKGLRVLAEVTGEKFRRGIVLYAGHGSVPFGAKLCALPLTALWHL